MPDRRAVGREAEDRVAAYLLQKGYTIVTRRFTTRQGEIDLVALDGDILVFIEVKFRRQDDQSPEAGLDARKVKRFHAAALAYLEQNGQTDKEIRFDFVAVDAEEIRHYVNAFHG